MDDVKVTKMEFPDKDGGINIAAKSPAFAILASECVKWFKEAGGVNYCEWRLNSGDPAFGTFTVTIQREDGRTLAQVNADLRTERAAALLQIDELKKALRASIGMVEGRPNPYSDIKEWKKLLDQTEKRKDDGPCINHERITSPLVSSPFCRHCGKDIA